MSSTRKTKKKILGSGSISYKGAKVKVGGPTKEEVVEVNPPQAVAAKARQDNISNRAKLGGVAGGLTGVGVGAVVGTAVLPGVGTAVGAAIGGAVGGGAGMAAGTYVAANESAKGRRRRWCCLCCCPTDD